MSLFGAIPRSITCDTSVCRTPAGRPLAVQIGSPADLSLNRITIRLNRSQNRPQTKPSSLRNIITKKPLRVIV